MAVNNRISLRHYFLGYFRNFLSIGDTEASSAQESLEHSFIIYIGFLMSLGGLVWAILAWINGLRYQALLPLSYAVFTAINFTYLYNTKDFKKVQFIQIFISLMLPFLFQVIMGGFVASGGVLLWSILTILVSFRFQRNNLTSKWFLFYIMLILFSGIFDNYFHQFNPGISPEMSVLFFTINFVSISTIIMTLFYYYANSERKLHDRLEALAHTDVLTGLANRRFFFQETENFVQHHNRHTDRTALLMMDIDHFKDINDSYGHDAGDIALKRFAQMLQSQLRTQDLAARYGGEEFVVLLHDLSLEDAENFAKRVVETCRNITIKYHDVTFKLTVSIGVSELRKEDMLIDLLRRSDQALYAAKEGGRNQYRIAP